MRTLRSVAQQTLPPQEWELVVVDNNSTDDTRAVFGRFAAENPALDARVVGEPNQGLSWARNRGIAESRAPLIAMIDDDEEINPGFLASYVEFFETHPEAVAAGGRIEAVYESERPAWMSCHTERPVAGILDRGRSIAPFRKGYPGGGNMAFRREVFDACGLFDTGLGRTGEELTGGEEKDMFRRITARGAGVYYVPGAVVRHIIPPSKVTNDYFREVTCMCGVSERKRTLAGGRGAYVKALVAEAAKWAATWLLALWYYFRQQPQKAHYLVMMRRNISKGLLTGRSGKKKKRG